MLALPDYTSGLICVQQAQYSFLEVPVGLRGDSRQARSTVANGSTFVNFVRFVVKNLSRISANVYWLLRHRRANLVAELVQEGAQEGRAMFGLGPPGGGGHG